MRGIFSFLAPLSLVVLAACPGGADAHADLGGNLSLKRESPRPAGLLDAPVRARYCARDSVLWLVAVDREWTAAIALRTGKPWGRHFIVTSRLAGLDSGSIAVRPIADSIGPAVTAARGTLDLSGDSLSGRFAFESGSDSTLQRFSGVFKAMRADTNGCGNP